MLVFWVILFVLCVTGTTRTRQHHLDIEISESEVHLAERARRSLSGALIFGKLFYKGITARNALLQGAKTLENYPSKGPKGVKQFRYTKPGSWAKAKRDFYAVQPTNVERGNMGQTHIGSIGDRTIELQKHGPFDFPAIKIFTVKPGSSDHQLITDEIIYVDKSSRKPEQEQEGFGGMSAGASHQRIEVEFKRMCS